MKTVILFLLSLFSAGGCLLSDPVVQVAVADERFVLLNKLATAKNQEPCDQMHEISFGSIMTAKQLGYSNKEIFESATRTNNPRVTQLNVMGYHLHQNVIDYLSPTNDLAAKTAPTPEPVEDVQKRMEIEAAITAPPKPQKIVDDRKEMLRIYNEAIQMQQRAELKALQGIQK